MKFYKIINQRHILYFSLIFTLFFETLISAEIITDSSGLKLIQYIVVFFPLILCFFHIWEKRKTKYVFFKKELIFGIILTIVFALLSLYRTYLVHWFYKGSIVQLFQILMPFIYVYFIINELTSKEIMQFMKIVLFFTVCGFLYQTGIDKFTLTNLFSISFINSYSPFENFQFAEIANGLGCFFIYNRKKAPKCFIISMILNYFIFKRVLLFMLIFLCICSLMKIENKKIPTVVVNFGIVIWCFIIYGYYYIATPSGSKYLLNNYGININNFSMGRVQRLWYLFEKHFTSYGLGSTSNFICKANKPWLGGDLEMDFIRFIVEIGFISIPVFLFVYYKVCKGNLYSLVMISFCFLNLLMANGIVKYLGYTVRLLTIALIIYDNKKQMFCNNKLRKFRLDCNQK